jgi:putative phage-type endonuclease
MSISTEQKNARWAGLGGSDAPVLLGLSPYKTPFQLHLEKTGQVDPPDLDDLEHIRWGNILEAPVAAEFTRQTGLPVAKVNTTMIHKRLPFMLANIDRRIVGKPELLEVKTVRALPDDAPNLKGDLHFTDSIERS